MTLNTPDCVNRGYVLDCFPENHKQANNVFKKIFPLDEEGNPPEEEEIEDDLDTYDIPEPVEGEEPPEEEEPEEEEPEEEEEEEEGAFVPPEGKVPTPEYVLVLSATDEELADRVKVCHQNSSEPVHYVAECCCTAVVPELLFYLHR